MGNRNSHDFTKSSSLSLPTSTRLETQSHAYSQSSRPKSLASLSSKPSSQSSLYNRPSSSIEVSKRTTFSQSTSTLPVNSSLQQPQKQPIQRQSSSQTTLSRLNSTPQNTPRQYNDEYLRDDLKKFFKAHDKRNTKALVDADYPEDNSAATLDRKLSALKDQRKQNGSEVSGESETNNTLPKKSRKTKKAPTAPVAQPVKNVKFQSEKPPVTTSNKKKAAPPPPPRKLPTPPPKLPPPPPKLPTPPPKPLISPAQSETPVSKVQISESSIPKLDLARVRSISKEDVTDEDGNNNINNSNNSNLGELSTSTTGLIKSSSTQESGKPGREVSLKEVSHPLITAAVPVYSKVSAPSSSLKDVSSVASTTVNKYPQAKHQEKCLDRDKVEVQDQLTVKNETELVAGKNLQDDAENKVDDQSLDNANLQVTADNSTLQMNEYQMIEMTEQLTEEIDGASVTTETSSSNDVSDDESPEKGILGDPIDEIQLEQTTTTNASLKPDQSSCIEHLALDTNVVPHEIHDKDIKINGANSHQSPTQSHDSGHDEPTDLSSSITSDQTNGTNSLISPTPSNDSYANDIATAELPSHESDSKPSKKGKHKYTSIHKITKSMKSFMSSIGKSGSKMKKEPLVAEPEIEDSTVIISSDNWTLSGKGGKKTVQRDEYNPPWLESTFRPPTPTEMTSDTTLAVFKNNKEAEEEPNLGIEVPSSKQEENEFREDSQPLASKAELSEVREHKSDKEPLTSETVTLEKMEDNSITEQQPIASEASSQILAENKPNSQEPVVSDTESSTSSDRHETEAATGVIFRAVPAVVTDGHIETSQANQGHTEVAKQVKEQRSSLVFMAPKGYQTTQPKYRPISTLKLDQNGDKNTTVLS